MDQQVSVFWFRRDLRLNDNAGLYHALKSGHPVVPLFIFDRHILDELERDDTRVAFIHRTVTSMQQSLRKLGSSAEVHYGYPEMVFRLLLSKYRIAAVYTNRDYEPYATERDNAVAALLQARGVSFHLFKDQVIFDTDEVMKKDGTPYVVFTPYSREWLSRLSASSLKSYPIPDHQDSFCALEPLPVPALADMGFTEGRYDIPAAEPAAQLISKYAAQRDFPAAAGTSRLGVHLRFGTVSIREIVRYAKPLSDTFVKELVWREFYQMILWHFPQVGKGAAFRKEFDHIKWRNDEREFALWQSGMTGYPIVDAGMRELNSTGFMHNRVRMITASFLTKHLLIDWRWGEAYFAGKLLDYEFASNNGGWQWVAGTGCDAAPYFRIFNPAIQTRKFDPDLKYVRRWVPELDSFAYPSPIVDHDIARKRCLAAYAAALKTVAS